jgi:hypothetical protein
MWTNKFWRLTNAIAYYATRALSLNHFFELNKKYSKPEALCCENLRIINNAMELEQKRLS